MFQVNQKNLILAQPDTLKSKTLEFILISFKLCDWKRSNPLIILVQAEDIHFFTPERVTKYRSFLYLVLETVDKNSNAVFTSKLTNT